MQEFQQRVVDEKAELDSKRETLGQFIGCAIFIALPEDEQKRLTRQKLYMDGYSEILSERIAAFA